mmetsp:Transcript_23211/g.41051  ORF Transcript_23211/g.41051 Transcript_23211/m.41051 type:complete len:92 (+) Transcript_23211:98-373(+)
MPFNNSKNNYQLEFDTTLTTITFAFWKDPCTPQPERMLGACLTLPKLGKMFEETKRTKYESIYQSSGVEWVAEIMDVDENRSDDNVAGQHR